MRAKLLDREMNEGRDERQWQTIVLKKGKKTEVAESRRIKEDKIKP